MKTNTRKQYEAPTVQVVEMQIYGGICQQSVQGVLWFLNGSEFGSDTEFGRDGYGNATTF